MGPVEELLTSRFLNLYGPPDAFDVSLFVAEYTKALDGTEPDILREAADRIVRKHKYRNWPTVGECVEVVEEIAEQRMLARRREAWGYAPERRVEPSQASKDRISTLVRGVADQLKSRDRPVRISLPAVDRNAWENRLEHSPTAKAMARIHNRDTA